MELSPLITVEGLTREFSSAEFGKKKVLNQINLQILPQDRLGIIGESGSGKSTLLRCLAGLDTHFLGNKSIHHSISGSKQSLQMVFQDPMESLSPRYKVRDALQEGGLISNRKFTETELQESLSEVLLDKSLLDRFPNQLSGGQRQRISIARALLLRPKILLCDEPASALDLSTGVAVLKLLEKLCIEKTMSLVLVSHDVSQVQYFCKRVIVLYQGEIVEAGSTSEVLSFPQHPYTQHLIRSRPRPKWLIQ